MSSSTAAGSWLEIAQQGVELIRVVEQGHDAVADDAGRGVLAGDDELEQAGKQFLGGERVVADGDQHADQVVAWARPLGGDQFAQVSHDLS